MEPKQDLITEYLRHFVIGDSVGFRCDKMANFDKFFRSPYQMLNDYIFEGQLVHFDFKTNGTSINSLLVQ